MVFLICVFTQAGHGWDVKSVDWHPTKSLLVSGRLLQLLFVDLVGVS